MQAPFPLFGALNVPYRIIELLHTNRHRELLRRYCFHCHKDVCYSFLPIDETSTTSVESEMGGFYEGYQKIVVKKIKDWFVDSYSDSIGTLECETSIDLTEKEYKKVIHNIYPTLKNEMKTMMI